MKENIKLPPIPSRVPALLESSVVEVQVEFVDSVVVVGVVDEVVDLVVLLGVVDGVVNSVVEVGRVDEVVGLVEVIFLIR